MTTIRRLTTGLAALLLAGLGAAHAQSPRVVLFEDPALGAERLHYPLLISEGRGYRILCPSQEDEEAVIRGLGFTSVPSQVLTAVDPDVVGADPAANPLLCPSGPDFPIQTFAKDGPEGRVYYLQFPSAIGSATVTDRLYVPRCPGLTDALEIDLEQALEVDPTPFFTGKIHEISCLTGNGTFPTRATTFAAWCTKTDSSPEELATVKAVLDATPTGSSGLGNPSSCTAADGFLRSVHSLNLNGQGVRSLAPLGVLKHLTSLSLAGNEIDDLAPLAELNALTFLDVADNQVTNVVPLAPLTALTRLNLSDNRIADVRSLSALSLLTSLTLDGNAVLDLSPLQFLQALGDLSLARNGLTGEMLEPLTALGALTRLDVSDNAIETFANLGDFPSTVEIEISGNPIAVAEGGSFLDLCIRDRDDPSPFGQTVRVLADLHGGGTCRSVSDALAATTTLDLSGKGISDVRPVGSLTHLTVLDLSDNAISDVTALSALSDLVDLDISENNVTDVRPLGRLSLTDFDASGNPVALDDFLAGCVMRHHEAALTPAQAAEVAALLAASGRENCEEANNALRQVQVADVSGRALTTLAYFPVMERLQSLDAASNDLTDLTPLASLPGLTRLWVQQNRLTSMQSVARLRHLESLVLDQNPLPNLQGIQSLAKLERVSFSSTGVRSVQPLESLPLLESATMRNLSLVYGSFGEYCIVNRFDSIALGEERAFVAAIEPALAAAHVDTADCAAVEEWARTVTVLNLNKKSINSVRPIVFFTDLQELHLYDNLVRDAQPIGRLRNLQTLNLSSNRLTSVPRFDSTGLKSLYLADNQISHVGNLSNLTQLTSLNLRGNSLVDPSPVGGLATLSAPDLRNNQITTIPNAVTVLARQPYLKGNPVCQFLVHHGALNEACRKEPPMILVDIVHHHRINDTIILRPHQ